MVLTSHQPNFMPYMGFFYKISQSDILVLSDDVLFSKKGMHNWNWICTKSGPKKLTLPVHAHHDCRLADVGIDRPEYTIPKIIKTLDQEYRKSPKYNECQDTLHLLSLFAKEGVTMVSCNAGIIQHLMEKFGLNAQVLMGTGDLTLEGHKDERIFQMCEKTGADVYYSGTGAKAYHEDLEYESRGIKLIYSDYNPVVYTQMHSPFIPNMSCVDYIFNVGYELPDVWSRKEARINGECQENGNLHPIL